MSSAVIVNKNKSISRIFGLCLSLFALAGLYGCGSSNRDATAPVITLTGDNPQMVFVGDTYAELGATAQDNKDGDISAAIVIDSSAVDATTVGSYSVTYNVSDAAGNAAVTQTRTVTVQPNQDASGLFKDGTAELNSSAIMLNDLRAFVHDNRIMMFSVAGHLLIDGQINSITGDDYTATVDIYEQGVKTQSAVSVVGKVTTASQITGTLSGTGAGSGTFTLTFDTLYNRGATFARVDTSLGDFAGDVFNTMIGAITSNFGFSNMPDMYSFTAQLPGPIRCRSSATYTMPDNSINIYTLDENLIQLEPGCTMSDTPSYTGFTAVIDGITTDDTLLYATSNGTNAQFAVLIK